MASLSFHLCGLVLLAALLNPVSCLKHVPLFSFGDVIYDQGNNNYVNSSSGNRLKANFPPYGQTFFEYAQGRFSDGRVISDFIAEYAGLPLILPYLHPGNNIYNYIYGSNFASGGCTALRETREGQVVDFDSQILYYKKVVLQLKKELGKRPANQLVSNAVHLFSIGNSDYLSAVLTPSDLYVGFTQEEYVDMVIGNITNAIKEVYNAGGRKFGFMSLGTLGCFPNVRQLNYGRCNENLTAIAAIHNRLFPTALRKLETQLSGFIYSYFDYHAVATAIMNNPQAFGFKVVDKGCCGTGPYRGSLTCGRQLVYEQCDNPNDYVFWDAGHGSDHVNGLYANLMWNGGPKLTGRHNLKTLFARQSRKSAAFEDFQNILSALE